MQFEIKEKPITWFPKYLSKFWNNSGNWMLERIHTGYGRVPYFTKQEILAVWLH